MKARGRSRSAKRAGATGAGRCSTSVSVVIHVFYHPVREFYDLESLWVDAPRLPLEIPPESVMARARRPLRRL